MSFQRFDEFLLMLSLCINIYVILILETKKEIKFKSFTVKLPLKLCDLTNNVLT